MTIPPGQNVGFLHISFMQASVWLTPQQESYPDNFCLLIIAENATEFDKNLGTRFVTEIIYIYAVCVRVCVTSKFASSPPVSFCPLYKDINLSFAMFTKPFSQW